MALTAPQDQILAGDSTDLCNAARREHQSVFPLFFAPLLASHMFLGGRRR